MILTARRKTAGRHCQYLVARVDNPVSIMTVNVVEGTREDFFHIKVLCTIPEQEKTGSLRCFLSSKDDFIDGLIQMSEEISGKTCEVCGEPGLMDVENNVVQVRCLRHGGRTEAERDRSTTIWRLEPNRPAPIERRVPGMTEEGAHLWILDLLNEVADDYCVRHATGFRVNAVRQGDGLQFEARGADQRLDGMMAMTSAFWRRRLL